MIRRKRQKRLRKRRRRNRRRKRGVSLALQNRLPSIPTKKRKPKVDWSTLDIGGPEESASPEESPCEFTKQELDDIERGVERYFKGKREEGLDT